MSDQQMRLYFTQDFEDYEATSVASDTLTQADCVQRCQDEIARLRAALEQSLTNLERALQVSPHLPKNSDKSAGNLIHLREEVERVTLRLNRALLGGGTDEDV